MLCEWEHKSIVRVSILIGKVEIYFKCTIFSEVQCSDATKV